MSRAEILDKLFDVILARKAERPAGSYVVQLLDAGVEAIAAKIREEGEEVIEAAGARDAEQVAHEVADLIFHAWVMLAVAGANPERVFEVLEQRFGTGGLVEKASRTPSAEDEQQ
jgi:phosphoribosyl-ATP pyrophosphohydrolase